MEVLLHINMEMILPGFSVASVRGLVDSVILDNGHDATPWNQYLPIKVNVFVWRLMLNRLPSRVNLDRRNIEPKIYGRYLLNGGSWMFPFVVTFRIGKVGSIVLGFLPRLVFILMVWVGRSCGLSGIFEIA
nr:RNA-directed DNA polymerase, eukaryota [Tanacetum cinerariifolium]